MRFFDNCKYGGVLGCLLASSGLASPVSAEVRFGLAKDLEWSSVEHRALMEQYGVEIPTVYYNLLSPANVKNPYDWVQVEYLDKGFETVIVTLLLNGTDESSAQRSETSSENGNRAKGNHTEIIGGKYDEQLRILASEIARDGRRVYVNVFHEFDGDWFDWGIYAEGNSVESFILAYEHVRQIFYDAKAPVDFLLNPNRLDGKQQVMGDIDAWFPRIDPLVAGYAVSNYDRGCTTALRTKRELFAEKFGPAYDKLAALTKKPINLAEVATSGLCGPREPWYEEMLASILVWYPQVDIVTFYFGTVPVGAASNTVPIVWGFPTDEGKAWLKDLVRRFKERESALSEVRVVEVPVSAPEQLGARTATVPVYSAPPLTPRVTTEGFGVTAEIESPWSIFVTAGFGVEFDADASDDSSGAFTRFVARKGIRWPAGQLFGLPAKHGFDASLSGAFTPDEAYLAPGIRHVVDFQLPRTRFDWGSVSYQTGCEYRVHFDGDEDPRCTSGLVFNAGGDGR